VPYKTWRFCTHSDARPYKTARYFAHGATNLNVSSAVDAPKVITPIRRRSSAGPRSENDFVGKSSTESKPRPAAIKKHRVFLALSFAVNSLLLASVLLAAYGAVWEYSTRRYLKGFSDAIIPASSSPEKKVAAILAWMAQGPQRQAEAADDEPEDRDPVDTLNYQELLRVCGTATNAFVNLAASGGIETRRLLLLGPDWNAKHVVAEVHMGGGWFIVDPSFHAILRDNRGRLLTRVQLADPGILREATQYIPDYDPGYNYQRTTHVRLARIPLMGRFLPKILNSVLPDWEESINWTVMVERQSYAVLVTGIALLILGLFLRRAVEWYAETYLPNVPPGPWDQLRLGGLALLAASPAEYQSKSPNQIEAQQESGNVDGSINE
jgi:hypothetical protein